MTNNPPAFSNTKKLVLSAFFLALGLVLPFLTGQIPEIGNMISPMHFPVMLCGFICGGPYGALVGLILPPLRFLLFQMPPLFPTGIAMAFEMGTYGLVCGLLYGRLQQNLKGIYLSLIGRDDRRPHRLGHRPGHPDGSVGRHLYLPDFYHPGASQRHPCHHPAVDYRPCNCRRPAPGQADPLKAPLSQSPFSVGWTFFRPTML